MSLKRKQEKDQHYHSWHESKDDSEENCVCGCVLVSQAEFDRREKEWDEYLKKVKETRSYKRFIEQKEAMKKGDLAKVKELVFEAKKERETKTDWLPKPHFPDYQWPKYIIKEKEEFIQNLLYS